MKFCECINGDKPCGREAETDCQDCHCYLCLGCEDRHKLKCIPRNDTEDSCSEDLDAQSRSSCAETYKSMENRRSVQSLKQLMKQPSSLTAANLQKTSRAAGKKSKY
jgi:hypothetical protein